MFLKKLVIAEDEEAIAHLIAATLGDAGFLCLRARDGEAALELVRTELPDLLVLDWMLPKMEGIEVCRRVKRDLVLSRVPILMLTSMSDVENRIEGLEAGADDYLSKPFDLRELNVRVKALIRHSRRERGRNPTTDLPGREAIEDQVVELIERQEAFGLLYVDVAHFEAYAAHLGYRKADEVVALVGRLVLEQCRSLPGEQPFVGHLGGDDFVLGSRDQGALRQLGESLRLAFEDAISAGEGGVAQDVPPLAALNASAPAGPRPPRLALHVALVEAPTGRFGSVEQLAQELVRAKGAGKGALTARPA
ncbi:MAG: response regulator [Proteobacteria bacterium]|nr:response regulator [Pseudomonadota bacterium]